MEVLFIIGPANSGKSTLIRNLTGIGQDIKSNWLLQFNTGAKRLFLRNTAVQEYNPNQPDGLLTQLNEVAPTHELAIIPLRIKLTIVDGVEYPKGENYINTVKGAFNIIGIIKLSDFRFDSQDLERLSHNLAQCAPYNRRAAYVRDIIGLV